MNRLGAKVMMMLIAIALGGTAHGATVYVDDRLQIGLHEENDLASTILELLPSGTALEVLARGGALARVRLPDGREGWVDAAFLVEEAPGRARQQTMQSEMDALKAELAGVQAQLAEAQAALTTASTGGTETQQGQEAIPSDTLREMQRLVEENQRLKQTVSELEAVQRMAAERTAALEQAAAEAGQGNGNVVASAPARGFGIANWERWQQVLLASALLLAFAAGGWVVDWGVRRRHGGFRV